MVVSLAIDKSLLQKLELSPTTTILGSFGKGTYTLRFSIPNYQEKFISHYSSIVNYDVKKIEKVLDITLGFKHFGLVCEFDKAIEVTVHDKSLTLDYKLKPIIRKYGPIIFINAYLSLSSREPSHKNRFPHLNFHRDRNEHQPTPYSLFSRNPFDQEQYLPRSSSTLFIPHSTAIYQHIKEGNLEDLQRNGFGAHYNLFSEEEMDALIGNVIMENRWDKPEGVGELSILDNRAVLHASYYRHAYEKGYRIGVKYLA